jgi:tetratricopeptide (TPR) repeat protein
MDNRHQRRQNAKARSREVEAHMRAARKAMQDGDAKAAELACQAAIKSDPLIADPYHVLSHIAYGQGRLAEAGDFILEAVTRDDGNLDIHADCGAIMNMLGRAAEAEAACRHVVGERPDHAAAWNNLGVALDQQGRREEALDACDEALALNPGYVDAMVNKGSVLVKSGRPVDAIETLAGAVQAAPDNPLARVNLAAALRAVGEYDLACDQCEIAIEAHSDSVEAHGALGDAHAAAGRFDAALAAYDTALEKRPGHMAVRLNRAAALFKLDRLDEATAAYRGLLDDFDENAEAHAGLGVVLLAAGDIAAGAEAFRRAVTLNPRHGMAWAALAASPDASFDTDDIEVLGKLADDETADPEARIAAHFALADISDRTGDVTDAFTHYAMGNALRARQLAARDQTFDAAALHAEITETMAAYPTDPARQGGGSEDERPVFVLGMPRSGTTLVEQILASHPQAVGQGEAGSLFGLDHDLGEAENAAEVLRRLGADVTDAKRIVDKTPFHFHEIGTVRRLFPKARIVHCRRDTADTGLSCFMQNFVDDYPWSCDLGAIGAYIKGYETLMDHWRRILADDFIEIDYEKLVEDPETEIRGLLEAVGLPWDDACLAFHETRRTVRSASNWQVRRPIYKTAAGRAERYATHLAPLRDALG